MSAKVAPITSGLKQIEGSEAVAEAVALCRPEVICAYPISPQTHIVEGLSRIVKSEQLEGCEYVNVESEFAAMSVAIGSSATGARTYTATASQGLLYMVEAVYNASGLGLPIVMTVANRAIGAPINIWNDQSDSMSQRDSGWIQLYARDNQEALDLHIQAFRLAEEVSLPVMVCMDGFVLTHAVERVDMPTQEQVDEFLPPYMPRQVLDPADPVSIGAMVGPEAFTEVRYLAHVRQMQALALIPRIAEEFRATFGRDSGGLTSEYRLDDADLVVVALGSVIGTLSDAVDELREDGIKIGVLGITSFRPFPELEVGRKLARAKRIIVLERAFSVGIGGIVSHNIRTALETGRRAVVGRDQLEEDPTATPPAPASSVPLHTVIAGLGGRPIGRASLHRMVHRALTGDLEDLHFLDLDHELVQRELRRSRARRRSGPAAENMLRDIGTIVKDASGAEATASRRVVPVEIGSRPPLSWDAVDSEPGTGGSDQRGRH